MKKILSILIVLTLVVGMYACMGVQAAAASADGMTLIAVSGDQLSTDDIASLKGTHGENAVIIDVDGQDAGQSVSGYSLVYSASETGSNNTVEGAYLLGPGCEYDLTFGPDANLIPAVFVGVGPGTTAQEIMDAIPVAYTFYENCCVIAIGAPEASQAVQESGADVFLTTGIDPVSAAGGGVLVVNVDGIKGVDLEFSGASETTVTMPAGHMTAPGPVVEATPEPTPEPTAEPTPEPTAEPTPEPTAEPTPEPTEEPAPAAIVPELQNSDAAYLKWTLGGDQDLPVAFTNASVSGVDVKDASGAVVKTLARDTDFTTENEGKTLVLTASGLNGLTAGSYKLAVTFNADAATGAEVEPKELELTVEDAPAAPAEPQDPGMEPIDTLLWKKGGTDDLTVTFANAAIATVKVGVEGSMGTDLAEGPDYSLANEGKKIIFTTGFLDGLQAGTYKVEFTFLSDGDITYSPASVTLSVSEADVTPAPAPQDPGMDPIDTLTWKKGGTDALVVSFANATVDVVKVGAEGAAASPIAEGSDFTLENDGHRAVLQPNYLNKLQAGTYHVVFSFDTNGDITYQEKTVTLSVRPEDTVPTPATIVWADRSLAVTYACAKTPTGLQVNYDNTGGRDWHNLVKDRDFSISGNTLTLLPAMINTTGYEWSAGGYTLNVVYSDGTGEELSLRIQGAAPPATATPVPTATPVATATAAPTPTPIPGQHSPVTGDTTPIALYVGILLIALAALAVVIVIMVKRRRS